MVFWKRTLLFAAIIGSFGLHDQVHGDDGSLNFFRIGTGSHGGIYHPVGGIIASTISNPPGERECVKGGNCGVPGLIAVAKSSEGSISNLKGLLDGELDSAFIQADILYQAYQGSGLFEGQKPLDDLRVLSSLFDEAVHVVVRKDSEIKDLIDLKGKKISLGLQNSDDFYESMMVLNAIGLLPDDLQSVNLSGEEASRAMRKGEIDGFIIVGGYPIQVVSDLAKDNLIRLIALSGMETKAFRDQHKFLNRDLIPADIYPNMGQIETLSIPTIWVTTNKLDEQTAYQILKALWHENHQVNFENAFPVAQGIRYSNSFAGVRTPIHDGAMLFHEEVEVAKQQRVLRLDQPESGTFDKLFKAIAGEPE